MLSTTSLRIPWDIALVRRPVYRVDWDYARSLDSPARPDFLAGDDARVGNMLELTADSCGRALLMALLVALPSPLASKSAKQ